MKKKVLVVGFDGASLGIIQQAIRRGKMPFLTQLLDENGELLQLRSTIPPSTAPAWTSMMTGVNPGKHGIYDFLIHHELETRPATIYDVKKPFVWDILAKNNIKSIIIGHPLTYPVRRNRNIVMVSGILAPRLNEKSVSPYDVLDLLKSEGYSIDIENKMPFLKNNPEIGLEICNESVMNRLNGVKRLLRNYQWDFCYVLFPEPDRLLHYHIVKESIVMEHFSALDKVIKELATLDNSVLFMVSDHGFTKIRRVFTVNSFLNKLGLSIVVAKKRRARLLKLYRNLPKNNIMFRILSKIGGKFDYEMKETVLKEESLAWFTPYAESGIRLGPRLGLDEKDKVVHVLIKALNNLTDPKTGERVVKAFRREKIFWGDEVDRAPDIVLLSLKNFVSTHIIPSDLNRWFFDPDELFLKEGDHVCEWGLFGILGVHGIRIAHDKIPEVMDIAPTILEAFGLKLDKYSYMDGDSLLR